MKPIFLGDRNRSRCRNICEQALTHLQRIINQYECVDTLCA